MKSISKHLSEAWEFCFSFDVTSAHCLFRTIWIAYIWQLKNWIIDLVCWIWIYYKVYRICFCLYSPRDVFLVLRSNIVFSWKSPLKEVIALNLYLTNIFEVLQPVPGLDSTPLNTSAAFTAFILLRQKYIKSIINYYLVTACIRIHPNWLTENILVVGWKIHSLSIVFEIVPKLSRYWTIDSGVALCKVLMESLGPKRGVRTIKWQCRWNQKSAS